MNYHRLLLLVSTLFMMKTSKQMKRFCSFFLWHFSICRLGRIMHGSFAKMTPINRHGLCCLALSVFDGPHEEARKIEGATCSIVVVRKRGWEVVHEGFASTNCCQSEMTSHSRLIMKQAKGDIRQWLSLTRLY